MYLNVTKELFNSGKNISIIGSAAQKFTTSKPIKNPEFYAKEIREKYAVKDSATATLNTAAFLVKALVKSELSLAVTPKDWTQQLVYGEFKHLNQDKSVSRYKFTCSLTPKIIVSYEENAPEEGNPYAMLPYFIARTFFQTMQKLILILDWLLNMQKRMAHHWLQYKAYLDIVTPFIGTRNTFGQNPRLK